MLQDISQKKDSKKIFINQSASVSGKNSGEISHKELLSATGLELPKNLIDSNYTIIGFELTVVSMIDKSVETYINKKDGSFTNDMIRAFSESETGTKLYFEQVKCVNGDQIQKYLYASTFILN